LLTLLFKKVILKNNMVSCQARKTNPQTYIACINEKREQLIAQGVEEALTQRLEFYISVFFTHLFNEKDLEDEIEVEQRIQRTSQQQSQGSVETYFKFRNERTFGFVLENYSFEPLLKQGAKRII